MRAIPSLALIAAALALTACDKPKPPAAKTVRPVLSMVVSQSSVGGLALAGSVQARVQTAFSFRTLGRMIARPVNAGDLVVAGQTLAAIDPISLKLAAQAAAAQLTSSQALLANAVGVEERQIQLLKTNSTTQALVEAAQQSRASAQSGVARAQAALAKAREQLDYAILKSDFAGVVTSVSGEIGQTVAPGQAVVTVAEPGTRDAVIDVPDSLAKALKIGGPFVVALQLNPSVAVKGAVREIAPEADAATRTRRVKIALDNPPDTFRLGSTITASLDSGVKSVFRLPTSAILKKDGGDFVWIVDPKTQAVATRKVADAASDEGWVDVSDGLEASMRVVTAGVHSLAEGQIVRADAESEAAR